MPSVERHEGAGKRRFEEHTRRTAPPLGMPNAVRATAEESPDRHRTARIGLHFGEPQSAPRIESIDERSSVGIERSPPHFFEHAVPAAAMGNAAIP